MLLFFMCPTYEVVLNTPSVWLWLLLLCLMMCQDSLSNHVVLDLVLENVSALLAMRGAFYSASIYRFNYVYAT